MVFSGRISRNRALTYAGISLALLVCSYPIGHARFSGSRELHTLIETASTLLTLVAGVMSLVRYYTGRSRAFLLLGAAFLGAAVLDGCHTILTSSFITITAPFGGLAAWSGVSSRAFLAILLAGSCHWNERNRVPAHRLASLLSLSFAPGLAFHRPVELVPGLFFGLAAVLYFRRGSWRHDSFVHFLILSILTAMVGHVAYMSRSAAPFDSLYMSAHVIKIVSYLLVLTGLFQSMIGVFRRETEASAALALANRSLEAEVQERHSAQDELDNRVRERTQDLASANELLRIQIAERKRTESELFFLAAIVESSDEAIFSKSLEGKILTWNAAAERTYGYGREELIGRTAEFLVSPERIGQERDCLAMVAGGESVRHLETVHLKKDGSAMDVLMTVFPLRIFGGKVTALAGIVSDTTHRRNLERQLAQAQKLESIGQLAAGVAHEINTPIQYVDYNIRFLQESFAGLDHLLHSVIQFGHNLDNGAYSAKLFSEIRAQIEHSHLEYLRGEIPRSIQQSLEGVEHVAQIVRAMKEYAHPGAVEKTPTDINRSIESAIQVSRNTWKYVADLKTHLDPNLPLVECVTGEFGQVILNLIVNAAQAVEELAQRQVGRGTIEITTRRDGPWAEIRVSDTGGGIPEHIRSSVFNPFFTTKPVGKGTGQGLAIAHAVVVQKHGGSIAFETEPGIGTTFIVRLPIGATERSDGHSAYNVPSELATGDR
jgi:PAS domain S-box-containing protein